MSVKELIHEVAGLGIEIGTEGGRIWFSPRSAVTPDLAERLKAHEGELLELLGAENSRRPSGLNRIDAAGEPAADESEPISDYCCARCRSEEYNDVMIHGGRSIRRDCRRCGRFICFPIWYGNDTC